MVCAKVRQSVSVSETLSPRHPHVVLRVPLVSAAPTCADGVQNGGEAGVDCGAPCGPCDAGTPCTSGATCASGVCTNGVCAAPTCSDGVKNGDESDVGGLLSLCLLCGCALSHTLRHRDRLWRFGVCKLCRWPGLQRRWRLRHMRVLAGYMRAPQPRVW